MAQPRFLDDPAFRCLRVGDFDGFNREVAGRQEIDFSNSDLRGVELRGIADLSKVIVRGAYMRDADLRGLDLRAWDMEGCSLYHAKISGTYFPTNLSPEEIANSVQLGTRMRTLR
jgi:uncharacterized protein YjbI with pentapeptide repeats